MRGADRLRLFLPVALAAGLVAAPAGWYSWHAVTAAEALRAAHDALTRLRADLLTDQAHAARVAEDLRAAQGAAREADEATSGAGWSLLGEVPVAGQAVVTLHGLAHAARAITEDVLPPLLRLRGSVAVAELAGPAEGPLREALGAVRQVQARLHTLPHGVRPAELDRARDQATGLADRLAEALGAAAVVPAMLGKDGVRRYFLAFQTNAEARGTGGLVGAFGILRAEHGRISIERVASDDDLPAAPAKAVELGPEFDRRYGRQDAARALNESNLSPHFPYAAKIWAELWRAHTGERVDGAFAVDPGGLAGLLAATGPVGLADGERLTAADAVPLTERDVYARFTDPVERKRFLVEVARAVADVLPERLGDLAGLRAMAGLAGAGRLLAWSAHPDEEAALAALPVGGVLPDAPGPFAEVVVNNGGGNKLDYYLDRRVTYELGPVEGPRRTTRITVRLANEAPQKGLPEYVTERSDDTKRHVLGANRLWVSVYAARGARLTAAAQDGGDLDLYEEEERHHPVYGVWPELRPGQVTTLRFDLDEPASDAPPRVPVQPLVRPQITRVIRDGTLAGR
jgi:hypothetical protein